MQLGNQTTSLRLDGINPELNLKKTLAVIYPREANRPKKVFGQT